MTPTFPKLATNHDSPLVVCRGVTKQFGEGEAAVMAPRGIDLDVYDGQITLLVGESGCGKTTLISVIAGLLDATNRALSVLGRDLRKLRGAALVHFLGGHTGFVFQH